MCGQCENLKLFLLLLLLFIFAAAIFQHRRECIKTFLKGFRVISNDYVRFFKHFILIDKSQVFIEITNDFVGRHNRQCLLATWH